MAQKPSIAKGTRDFTPEEVSKRTYIISTIKKHFETFGFLPIETPSFENLDTLMGKYGDEGDRLIFKILDSGEYFEQIRKAITDLEFSNNFVAELTEKIKQLIQNKGINEIKYEEDLEYRKKIKAELREDAEISSIFFDFYEDKKKNYFSGIFNNNELAIRIALMSLGKILDLAILSGKLKISQLKPIVNSIVKNEFYENLKSKNSSGLISGKALRYDLTVPFARYVVMHQNEIDLPFKRYQVQPVWRADRPQKGRFREFYQCDADVVGSKSLWQEVEFVQLYDAVFNSLKLEGITIKMNNRKILSGIAEVIGAKDKLIDFTVALDKLDKIGEDGVKKEMLEKGINEDALVKVQPLFSFTGSSTDKLNSLRSLLETSEEGMKGVEELSFIMEAIATLGLKIATLDLDVTLARGLNYYTGAIFEVSAPSEVKMGSIGGGGRYDDLTGIFGLKDVSGVGISFGLDRIYLVLEELNLFPEEVLESTKVLFLNFGEAEALYCLKALKKLREADVKSEMYPDDAKMKKQMNFANKRNIPFVVLAGSKEIQEEKFTLKNMKSGEQFKVTTKELIEKVS